MAFTETIHHSAFSDMTSNLRFLDDNIIEENLNSQIPLNLLFSTVHCLGNAGKYLIKKFRNFADTGTHEEFSQPGIHMSDIQSEHRKKSRSSNNQTVAIGRMLDVWDVSTDVFW